MYAIIGFKIEEFVSIWWILLQWLQYAKSSFKTLNFRIDPFDSSLIATSEKFYLKNSLLFS